MAPKGYLMWILNYTNWLTIYLVRLHSVVVVVYANYFDFVAAVVSHCCYPLTLVVVASFVTNAVAAMAALDQLHYLSNY